MWKGLTHQTCACRWTRLLRRQTLSISQRSVELLWSVHVWLISRFLTPTDAKQTTAAPLTIAEEMKQRMLRRQAAISGKQDQLEQKRDRDRFAKPVPVLTAKEVTAPSQPPPPPPPASDYNEGKRNKLPSVTMSDDGSLDGGSDSEVEKASNDGEVRGLQAGVLSFGEVLNAVVATRIL